MLATYAVNNAATAAAGTLTFSEHHLYGSSRLGIVRRSQDVDEARLTAVEEDNLGDTYLLTFSRGNKLFEVTNHLGTVVATLSDRRTVTAKAGDPTMIGRYIPVRMTAADYYPFGMVLPGRQDDGSFHRYGFNGKETDNEALGIFNELDYGMRAYDPIVGRFLSVDPLTKSYPELTPYQYASNNPVQNIDLDGLEGVARNLETGRVAKGPLDPNNFPASDGWITNMPRLTKPVFTATFKMVAREREIMMNNGLGTNYIGPESIVLDNIALDRQRYSNAVLDNIRGGLGGTIGYWVGGETGSFYGAAVDGIAFSLTGIPGNSRVLSRPQNAQTNKNVPTTESPLVRNTEKNMGNFVGMSREHVAAFMSGGYPASSGGKDLTVSINTKNGTVSATVDVVSANGNYVTVGGAAKANKLGSWGDHLTRLKQVAEAHGVKAQAYLDANSPKNLIEFTQKKLGTENVIVMPKFD